MSDDDPEFEDRDRAHAREFRSPVSPGAFYRALIAKGYTPDAAAGLTGNAIHESGGNENTIWLDPPTGPETGDAAHGAMQWEGARKRGLKPTLESTVNKIDDEISSGSQNITKSQLNAARSPEEAAALVNTLYERPQYPRASERWREQFARGVYNRYAGGATSDPPTATSKGSPTESSGQYLVERQKQRDTAREAAIRETGTGPSERNPAIAARGRFHHLHEIHGHISALHSRVADLEARIERKMRKGVVTDVDANKHQIRMEIGRDCDGSNQVKSPWLPYAQVSGGAAGLNVHSVPAVGEQVMLVNPDGSSDFTQALIIRHGWYSQNPSPSTDPNSDVTVRGTTINVRTMSTITHSIGGTLTGALKSLVTGGITRVIDALGHHISAPNALVDSSAKTHTHTSTDTHSDTATNGITHTTTAQDANVSAVAQKGNVTHTASQGNIVNSAPMGAITGNAMSIAYQAAGTLVSIT